METFDIREIEVKCRSKHGIYVMLKTLGHYYLPYEFD